MKSLALLLLAVPMFGQITIDSTAIDPATLGHSSVIVTFHINGTPSPDHGAYFENLRICWSTTVGACATKTPGTYNILGYAYPNNGTGYGQMQQPFFRAILTGLPSSTKVEACPELTWDRVTWSPDVCTTFTTLGKPAPTLHGIPTLPRGTVPTVPTDYTGFHSGASSATPTIAGAITTCDHLQADIQSAVNAQTSYGTLITLQAGGTCVGRYYPNGNPPDVRTFNGPEVNASTSIIHVAGNGLHEGDGVQFGRSFRALPGEYSTSALTCTGIKPAQVYYAHNVDLAAETFGLTCDKPFSQGGTIMRLHDAGSQETGFGGMYMAAYPRRKDQGGQLYPIVIHTSTPDSQLPPPGTRITPAWAPKLAALQPDCRSTNSNNCVYPTTGFAMQTFTLNFGQSEDDNIENLNANMWAIGLEIKAIDASSDVSPDPLPTWELVNFKEGVSDNGVDRCYIHGQYPFPNRLAHGIGWEGHGNMVSNSYFDRIVFPWHNNNDSSVANMTEGTQFFEASKGPGPYYFINNFFQSTGNGMHFNAAGDQGFQTKLVSDVVIKRNVYTQNPAGNHAQYCQGNTGSDGWEYRNRQPLEFKGGFRILLDGNIFEYDCHWQASSALALTSVGGGESDLTIQNNTWRHVSSVGMMGSNTQGGPPVPQATTDRYLYKNNLIWDVNGATYIDHLSPSYSSTRNFSWSGWVVQTAQDGEDMAWDHNTVVSASGSNASQFWLASGGAEGFRFTNSIMEANSDTNATGNGVRLEGNVNPVADPSCDGFIAQALLTCAWRYPGAVVSGNLVTSDSLTSGQVGTAWPSQKTTATPGDLSLVGWVQPSYASPKPDFHFKAGSNYISGGSFAATDNLDQGADINALDKAQGKVYFSSVVPGTTTASVAFVAPDAQGCPVDVSSTDPTLINSFTRFGDTGGSDGPRTVGITGLSSKTDYYFRINCAVEQPSGVFHTN